MFESENAECVTEVPPSDHGVLSVVTWPPLQ